MQDTKLAEVFDVSSIESEVSALVAERGPQAFAPSQRRTFNKPDRRLPEPRIEDRPEMAESTTEADATADGASVEVVHDPVNHPRHYTTHPSGIECIEITRWMNFNLGNAFKYIWRADNKGATIEDLKKARWYLDDEIARLEKLAS